MRCAIPLESPHQTFFKVHLRVVMQKFARLRNVGLRIADVAIAWRVVFGLQARTGNFRKCCQDLVQRNSSASTNVEYFSGNIGRFAGQKVCLHRVLDESEVAGLLPVAENDWLRFFQKRGAEFCEHS